MRAGLAGGARGFAVAVAVAGVVEVVDISGPRTARTAAKAFAPAPVVAALKSASAERGPSRRAVSRASAAAEIGVPVFGRGPGRRAGCVGGRRGMRSQETVSRAVGWRRDLGAVVVVVRRQV